MADWVFRGTSALALDAKGRINVPVRHRDLLIALCHDRGGKKQEKCACEHKRSD